MHDNVVVVGIDGSEPSYAALEWALNQSKERGARLHLVCAFELPTYATASVSPIPQDSGQYLRDAAEGMLSKAVEMVDGHGVEVTSALEFGDPTEILTELSKKAALVVIGGRSTRNKFSDRLLRTASSAVPAYAYCPTVVVPFHHERKFQPIEHIVVGVDGSEHGRRALQRAVWEADRWGARLTVLSAIPIAYNPGMNAVVSDEDILADAEKEIRAEIDSVLEGRDVKINVHAQRGNPSYVLPEFSKMVDLVIVGTRGRGGIAGLLLGSTSQMVLGQAECPVMVVPKKVRDGDDVGPSKRAE
ncbi:nucleotide-binding universal stress UspA family protein [Arcanobacterium wilhelmae]|uniref:Nucleotide-binding universal stress UspA family protein n=1 Tax=Arcanobacterium wilhelmae TaxID=1803177 RepID=A0ABT9NBS6_9ACTO|nr:universal stress protein [Arcanobacterium wilhelmae]MDP9801170.1 nucleotide-binding universal stress UspA family protein [Arcanobacterium wilhelmae]WFN90522.1 universal stress protein [Arcanobacterium wilhelmae]